MPRSAKLRHIERYEIERSPLAQKPTQRDVAALLGETRDDLRRLVNYKNEFIVRRQITTGKKGKVRDLAYPVARLRAAHERLKFHLNKVKQPSYLFSPRRNRGQRDNAALHLDQEQYLTLDLKQFYPSTSEDMVRRWFRDDLGMDGDVAGLLTHLCTIDGKVSFGSPATPVLCTLVHRRMFDQIADICKARGLQYSVWVDDLTISGRFVPRKVVVQIRAVVRAAGLKSHSIRYRSGNRPVFITGIGVVGARLIGPNSLNLKIKECWADYYAAATDEERDFLTQRLLSLLGTVRQISGAKSEKGRKAADEMNSLRQKRCKRWAAVQRKAAQPRITAVYDASDTPF
jgi:hypothetical protein